MHEGAANTGETKWEVVENGSDGAERRGVMAGNGRHRTVLREEKWGHPAITNRAGLGMLDRVSPFFRTGGV